MEEKLMSTPTKGEDNPLELLKMLSEEAEHGIIVVMEVVEAKETAEEEGSIDFDNLYEDM
jgi:hypothetical protein